MTLFVYELRKIFRQRSLLGIFAVCILLNLIFINAAEQNEHSYTPQMYMAMQSDLASLSEEEAYEKLSEARNDLEERIYWGDALTETDMEGLYPYTGNEWSELELLEDESKEREKVLGYRDYLQGIQQDADDMLGVSIFRQASGFSMKNIQKTAEDFSGMEMVSPEYDVSRGVTMATGFLPTDFLAVFLLFAVCIFLVLTEKQKGLLALICHTANGRRETVLAKMGVLAASTVIIFGAMYVGNFISAGRLYGFGDLNRAVQSVGDYQSSILPISVGQYFALFAGMKILVYLLIGMILFLICMWFKQLTGLFLSAMAVLGGSIALYYFVPENGSVFTFKYLNLFYFLRTDKLLMSYKNISLFGKPAGIFVSAAVLSVILIIVLILCNIYVMNGTHVLWNGDNIRLLRIRKQGRFPAGYSLRGFEYLKIMKKTGALLVLSAFFVIQLVRIYNYSFFQDPEEIYYHTYMEYLAGEITEQTDAYVEEENSRYEELLSADVSRLLNEELSRYQQDLMPYHAWQKVNMEYERVAAYNETSEEEVFLVYDGGYKQLMGENTVMDMLAVCFMGILFCVCFSSVFSGDSSVGMDFMIRTTKKGREDTVRAKKRVTFVWAFVVFAVVYGMDFIKIYWKIGLTAPDAPLQSLRMFGSVSAHMTIWQYLLLMYLIRFLGMIVMLHVIWILSKWCRDTLRTMLVYAILFVIPAVQGMIGITSIENITILPLLTGNRLLNALLIDGSAGYAVIYLLIGLALIVGIAEWLRAQRTYK